MNNEDRAKKVDKAYKQIKAINKGLTEQKIREKAETLVTIREKVSRINVESMFFDKKEQKTAKTMLLRYLEDYSISTIADENTVKQLIYVEVNNENVQNILNQHRIDQPNRVHKELIDLIHKNLDQISKLKEKLGIYSKKDDESDTFNQLQLIKKKYNQWLEENQASRTLSCPHCGKSVLWKIKTDIWDAQKHPFFRDRILGNKELVEVYKLTCELIEEVCKLQEANKLSGIRFDQDFVYISIDGNILKIPLITRERLSRVFEVSTDYITWLVEKGWKLPSKKHSDQKDQKDKNE